jgi:hypothetical protein
VTPPAALADPFPTSTGASIGVMAESKADDVPVLGDELVYTRAETARLLKISTRTLDKLRPLLTPVLIHVGTYVFRREDIAAYLRSLPAAPMRKPRGVAVRGRRGLGVSVDRSD